MVGKLSREDFIKQAIIKLRDTSKSRGIHTIYSGFNSAFREYFGEDPIAATQQLAQLGKIDLKPVKGGVMIYLPGEGPMAKSTSGKSALSIILDDVPDGDVALVEECRCIRDDLIQRSWPHMYVPVSCTLHLSYSSN